MPAPSLLEELLADQRNLTAVEQFSRAHDAKALAPEERRYRKLLPLEAPKPGEQFAFEVLLDQCSGCKACVTACHSLNGLDDNETWREVGLLVQTPASGQKSRTWSSTSLTPALQHVTTACHHCVDPGCLNGCPVLAYEKDATTGIVRHLDDQCIGCQYCVLKCPYDVPKYNERLGIVRKCDMCSHRLAVGEAPACVQACPNEAIRITKVETRAVAIEFRDRGSQFLSGAPAGDYTLPTTRFTSTKVLAPAAKWSAADDAALALQPAHWPLVFMLVLSQASVGAVGMGLVTKQESLSVLVGALLLGVIGLVASVFHLGRPMGAWRAFLNLRRSWMSREIVVFGLFPPLLLGAVAFRWSGTEIGFISANSLAAAAMIIGLVGVFCSAMIYHDTRRPLWNLRRSGSLFAATAVLLGSAVANLLQPSATLLGAVVCATIAKLSIEVAVLRHGVAPELTPLGKSARLIVERRSEIALARLCCAAVGGIGLPILLMSGAFTSSAIPVALVCVLLFAGELMERYFFFATVAPPKMPGGLPA